MKTYSTDINKLKRKPVDECHQFLPYYESENGPRQTNIDFESATELSMKEVD